MAVDDAIGKLSKAAAGYRESVRDDQRCGVCRFIRVDGMCGRLRVLYYQTMFVICLRVPIRGSGRLLRCTMLGGHDHGF